MRKQLYLDFKNKLKSIKDADNAPIFNHFDIWNRNVEFAEVETPFATPAVFIEFMPISWRNNSNKVQEADLRIRLHIVTRWFSGTADYSPTEQKALEYLDIADTVFKHLQGFSGSNFNRWTRTESIINHNHEGYVDSVEEYACNLRDYTAVPEVTTVQATPHIIKGK